MVPYSSTQQTTSIAVIDLAPVEPATPHEHADAMEKVGLLSSPAQHAVITPEQIRLFPKAGVRKRDAKKTGRQGSTRILTDTPVKEQIENEKFSKKLRKCKTGPKKSLQLERVSNVKGLSLKKKRTMDPEDINQEMKKKKKAHSSGDNSDTCKTCGVVYGDPMDKKVGEMWCRCTMCSRWFHDSCAQSNGILDVGDVFTCADCFNYSMSAHIATKRVHR